MFLLAVLSGKDLALCVSCIVYFSFRQRPQKPPFIYPEDLDSLRKDLKGRRPSHVPG